MLATKIDLFSESFGHKKNPALLLNAGAGGQSISWPDIVCKQLADRGYYVIRYDYRDTGLSTAINYETHPYTALDLAQDAVQILKHYRLNQAHCAGFSMGGQVAQLMAAHFPENILSITIISSSSDFRPGFKAFEGIFNQDSLSSPDPEYIKWVTRTIDSNQTLDEKLNDYVENSRFADAHSPLFDAAFFRAKGLRNYSRTTLHNPYANHAKCMRASFDLHEQALQHIKAPTLIIHGKKDPVFPADHAQDLTNRIPQSELVLWDDFAHAIGPQYFDRLVETMARFLEKNTPTRPL